MPGYRVDIPSVNMIYVFILLLQKNYRFCFFSLCCYFFRSKDLLAEAWGWGMLVPYDRTVELPDYCSYLEHYYKENCNVITEVTGSNLVDAAETCLKKENELVSLWDSKSKEWVDGILPRKTYILSSLIQEFAGKVKRTGEGISVVSIAALLVCTSTGLNRPNKSLVIFDHINAIPLSAFQ